MMQVLVVLAEQQGRLVTRRELLDRCWNGSPVGDDSLNRAVAGVRRALTTAAGYRLRVETIPSSGYVLAASDQGARKSDRTDLAIGAGWRSWRLGLPVPDLPTVEQLRTAAAEQPEHAGGWGMLALMLRHCSEYAEAEDCAQFVQECEAAAAQAFALDPGQPLARVALIGLPPLFGDWLARRAKLLGVLEEDDDNVPAKHDLAILEMATGRVSAAVPLIEELLARDPLAAVYHYKRTYHLWTLARLAEMDQVADRAMQLWPRHPAIWFARFWSLAFTGRPHQALQQLSDQATRPDLPPPALATLEVTLRALAHAGDNEARVAAIEANLRAAGRGPAQALAAIMHLAGLEALDEAFAVAESYLLRRGPLASGIRKTASDPSVTDQHRRVTQMLFLPVTAPLREDRRFLPMCDLMGMARYWRDASVTPDFLKPVLA
jgi:tetratricopeptide (TPR) repeat protein